MTSSATSPLAGVRVLVTRARSQAGTMRDLLTSLGATVVEMPVMEIVPTDPTQLDSALRRLASYDWLLFTSANAVDVTLDRAAALGLERGAFANVRVAAIGEATARRLCDAGVAVVYQPKRAVAESMLDGLTALGVAGSRMLLPRAKVARDILPAGLRAAGAVVDVVVAYETRPAHADWETIRDIRERGVDCVTFTSASSVRNTLDVFGGSLPDNALVACIGPVTADAAREAGLGVDILAQEYSIPGLVAAIAERFGRLKGISQP